MEFIIIALVLGSLFGIHALFMIFKVKPVPVFSALIHGLLAAVGLILLFVPQGKWDHGAVYTLGLILLIASTITGVVLEFLKVENSAVKSKIYAVVHTALSAAGVVLMIAYVVHSGSWAIK